MLSSLWERLRFPDRTTAVLDRRGPRGDSARAAGRPPSHRVPARGGAAGLALRGRRRASSRSAWSCPTDRTPCTSPTGCWRARPRSGCTLRPSMHVRAHDAPVNEPLAEPYTLTAVGGPLRGRAGWRPARAAADAARRAAPSPWIPPGSPGWSIASRSSRGYESRGELWSPGYFRVDLGVGEAVTLIASTESWETVTALEPAAALAGRARAPRRLVAAAHPAARTGMGAELVLAADQFIITPVGRVRGCGPGARRRRRGAHGHRRLPLVHRLGPRHDDQPRRADAGHRAATPRPATSCARSRHYVRDGLIPNLFPEGETRGALSHGRRHAVVLPCRCDRYLAATGDRRRCTACCRRCATSSSITCAARASASASIRADGLLRQGAAGYQLTWMDAKVGDWVVTPRRGKAVEINALWYNALRLLEEWLEAERDAGGGQADRPSIADAGGRESFNRRFWYEPGGYLYDVVDGEDGDDPACRPNQIFAISLAHPVLERSPLEAGAGRRCASGCSRRSACARSRPAIPTTSRATTATCAPATPPTIRARSGPG